MAGYTRNTVNIDVHLKIVVLIAIWSVAWAIQSIFRSSNNSADDDDADDGSKALSFQRDGITVLSILICNGLTFFLDFVTILLVCNTSVGHNAFKQLWYVSSLWALVAVMALVAVFIIERGPATEYWGFENISVCLVALDGVVLIVSMIGLDFMLRTFKNPYERGGVFYLQYTIVFYCANNFFQIFTFTNNFDMVNIGICGMDFFIFFRYLTFAPVLYLVLKRDCQYWSTDFDEEEEGKVVMWLSRI